MDLLWGKAINDGEGSNRVGECCVRMGRLTENFYPVLSPFPPRRAGTWFSFQVLLKNACSDFPCGNTEKPNTYIKSLLLDRLQAHNQPGESTFSGQGNRSFFFA